MKQRWIIFDPYTKLKSNLLKQIKKMNSIQSIIKLEILLHKTNYNTALNLLKYSYLETNSEKDIQIFLQLIQSQMKIRLESPFEISKKLNTDRSQHVLNTTRDFESTISSDSNKKNNSQIQFKNDRKNSVSSYYFKNYKKSKNNDTQSFTKYLKAKQQQTKRTRCITAINLTTNKISLQTEKSTQRQHTFREQYNKKIPVTETQIKFEQNVKSFCVNHKSKEAYFQQRDSFDCYCHDCSIQRVKENRRLLHLTPQLSTMKHFIVNKIKQTQELGSQLCQIIQRKVSQSSMNLEKQYKKLKMELMNMDSCFEKQNQRFFHFQLSSIDWNFINNALIKEKGKLTQVSFLNECAEKFKFKISKYQSKEKQLLRTQMYDESQKNRLNSSIINQDKQNSKPFARNSKLLQKIEQALNQNCKTTKVQVRSINLKKSTQKINKKILNEDKENCQPNFINLKLPNNTQMQQKQMQRISFGSLH